MGHAIVDSSPLVSVVIPAFNRAKFLARAINSVLNQTYTNLEIIVVDDGSTDNTHDVVLEYRDKAVRYVHQENAGACVARNLGGSLAKGDYIAFLDSDDSWHRERIAAQISCFDKAGPDLGLVYTDTIFVRPDGRVEKQAKCRGRIERLLLVSNVVGGASVGMVPKRVFDELGGFDADLPARQDVDMWLRIAQKYQVDFVSGVPTEIHSDAMDRISFNIEAVERGRRFFFEKHQANIRSQGQILGYMQKTAKLIFKLTNDRRLALAYIEKAIRLEPFRLVAYFVYMKYFLRFARK